MGDGEYNFCGFSFNYNLTSLSHLKNENCTTFRLSVPEANILQCFLKNRGVVQSKDTLLVAGWGDRPISSSSLPVAIANLRRYLNASDGEVLIRTLPRQGYVFLINTSMSTCISISNPLSETERNIDVLDVVPGGIRNEHSELTYHGDRQEKSSSSFSFVNKINDYLERFVFHGFSLKNIRWVILSILCYSLLIVNIFVFLYLFCFWIPIECDSKDFGTICVAGNPDVSHFKIMPGETWLVLGKLKIKSEYSRP